MSRTFKRQSLRRENVRARKIMKENVANKKNKRNWEQLIYKEDPELHEW